MWNKRTKPLSANIVGIHLAASGIGCCSVLRAAKVLTSAFTQPINKGETLAEALTRMVREHDLKGQPCNIVLSGDDYKLVQTEVPAVSEQEINQALLWSLRDVLDAKPEATVLDSFSIASGLIKPGKVMRHVVTAHKMRIQSIVDAVLQAGLDLRSIDIPELSQRNIAARLPENERGVGLISQGARGVSVALYRDGELYVNRQLAGIANLNDAGHPLTAPRLAEQLGLELLRTLDYFDSQQRQRPLAAIYLQPLSGEVMPLLDNLAGMLTVPIKSLRFEMVIDGGERSPLDTQMACFTALGAALREEVG